MWYQIHKPWVWYLLRKPRMARYYRRWGASLAPDASPLKDRQPWMVYEAIEWLQSIVRPGMQVFEWGGGGSTLFLAQHVGRVVSVDHDADWHAAVAREVAAAGVDNVELILRPPLGPGPAEPAGQYRSSDERYSGMSFESYARAIDGYPDESFDLVLVDGRAREGCAQHARPKVRPGGYLIFDNSERDTYACVHRAMAKWPRREFRGPGPYVLGYWSTTVWHKAGPQV
jgi:hypothetical protein